MSLPLTAELPQNARHHSEMPPPVPLNELVPEEIYWQDYYDNADIAYEWNNGRLEIKPVSDYQTYLMYAWFVELLRLRDVRL